MRFCPYCGTMLQVELNPEEGTRFVCTSCAYAHVVGDKPIVEATRVRPKRPEEVAERQETRAKMEVVCVKCRHNEAYFTQQQTRSADEAATIICECAKCGHTWKED